MCIIISKNYSGFRKHSSGMQESVQNMLLKCPYNLSKVNIHVKQAYRGKVYL